ncbi:trypsin inhibitor-like isoform X1 [Sipha flava]|uniref:Trypsin inhibitor-like isoform X1 n=1 Tax=Sipha flava TaxID=143950 RepID=A0A8B8GD27_9HEMI|nr:trypsin inhibitor-like isoform X1 [Sipha flava]
MYLDRRRSNRYWVIVCILFATWDLIICTPVTTFTRDDCYLPPDDGSCGINKFTLKVKYYFDMNNDDCIEFIYYGCGGNGNRFDSFDECENSCLLNYYF